MTLLKKIFEGYAEGFYGPSRFEVFMKSSQFSQIQGVEQEVQQREKDNATIYALIPYGVSVRYERHGDDEEIQVFLIGETDKVKYLEAIFMQEAETRGF